MSDADDPRVYLAIERTYLAWIRTGLALMGFGFVVARFGLFLREIGAARGTTVAPPLGVSGLFGTALVILGVALTFTAVLRYVYLLRKFRRGEKLTHPSPLAIALGIGLGIAGALVSVVLVMT